MLNSVIKVDLIKKFALLVQCQRNICRTMLKNEDNRLETFRKVCDEIGEERSYNNKAKILQNFFQKGSDQSSFKGDVLLWVNMLIPGAKQHVYNLQNKQMLKLFARLFVCDQQEMQRDLEQDGDVSETLRKYFEFSKKLKPKNESTLYLQEVEEFLTKLEEKTKEDEQTELLRALCKQATSLDLKMVIRLIKQDLRINAGARHILDAFGPLAYPAYQNSRDLTVVVKQFAKKITEVNFPVGTLAAKKTSGKVGFVQVMTPISPMLANACKSVEEAFKKCPSGLYAEIKYDGERVQIHKRGNDFKFYSRNLKPVMEHKIKRFHEYIPKAFPGAGDMILDSEIILVDTVTGDLLPFGTLGAHKKKEYARAEVCIFTFDCLLFNGEDLTNTPFHQRRKILEKNIKPIKACVQLSEAQFLKTKNELSVMTAKVLKANLEGVVLKNPNGTYQPGKRGWLKVKKDYLFGGKMADTADLVVLGGWYGSGKKGGILSIFLMGVYDRTDGLWKTVTKVHSGLDDATNEEIHENLMSLMDRADPNKIPTWLLCKKSLVPDHIAKSPDNMPVWEITGAEFTKSEAHTAAGISIRFPRITRLRDDKSADHANDLQYLQKLYDASKKDINVDLLLAGCKDDDMDVDNVVEIDSKLNLSSPMKDIKANEDDDDDEQPSSSKKLKKEPTKTEDEATERIKKPKIDKKENKMTKSPQQKQPKLDFSSHKVKKETKSPQKQIKLDITSHPVKTARESEMFNNLMAYFNANIEDSQVARSFVSNGGAITKDAKQANLAFYESNNMNVDLEKCRQTYKRTCTHLSIQWLQDSLNAKSLQPYPLYAVALKQMESL